MVNKNKYIQDHLDSCALIIRKYNLGDKDYFFSCFPGLVKSSLETAWIFGFKKIQNREIVKDASNLPSTDLEIVLRKANGFDAIPEKLFYYLNSEFDVKKFKLTEENIERRVRHLAAVQYLQLVSAETNKINLERKNSNKLKASNFFNVIKFILILSLIVGFIYRKNIIDGLTPVATLTERIHEKSKYKFNGAICNDGWTSHSQGRGTCSYHNGVDYYFYKGEYSKTVEQCRAEAIKLSWLSP